MIKGRDPYCEALAAALCAFNGDTKLPLLLDTLGPKVVVQLIAVLGGEEVKIPSWSDLSRSLKVASAAVDVVKNGTKIARAAKRHEVSEEDIIITVRAIIDGEKRTKALVEVSDKTTIQSFFK